MLPLLFQKVERISLKERLKELKDSREALNKRLIAHEKEVVNIERQIHQNVAKKIGNHIAIRTYISSNYRNMWSDWHPQIYIIFVPGDENIVSEEMNTLASELTEELGVEVILAYP